MELEKSFPHPPVPPPLPSPTSLKSVNNEKETVNNQLLQDPQTEVSKVCKTHWNYITNGNPGSFAISVYHQVCSILQDGPQCGLVALCMASQLLSRTLQVNDVFKKAKELGFTQQGEMFSARNMSLLAKDVLNCQSNVICDMNKQEKLLINHLLKGLPILVPYDADGNHEPCCKKGHMAHWAVITGFCLVSNKNNYELLPTCVKDPSIEQLYHWKGKNTFPIDLTRGTIKIYAKHGKSSRVALWNFDQLCQSNKNLEEFSTKHISSDFILPKNGIQNELANHAILLS